MNAKRFFYMSAGILLLVIAYTIGARKADAQSGGQFAGIAVDYNSRQTYAITTTGSIYARAAIPDGCSAASITWRTCSVPEQDGGWVYMGNVLGGAIAVEGKSMSDVKASYRK